VIVSDTSLIELLGEIDKSLPLGTVGADGSGNLTKTGKLSLSVSSQAFNGRRLEKNPL